MSDYLRAAAADAIADVIDAVDRDPRRPQVLRDRIVGGRTLDGIGAELGLTRERVRQLESELRADLAGPESIARLIGEVGDRSDPFLDAAELVGAAPGLLARVPGVGVSIFDVLAAIAPSWHRTGSGWVVAAGVDRRVKELLGELSDGAGLVDVAALAERIGVDEDRMGAFLTTVPRLFVHRGHAFTRDKSIGDRAVGLLALADGPMTTAQLAELIPGRTRPSIRNVLASTDRIWRCSPDTWTLVGRRGQRPVNVATPEYTAGMHRFGRRWTLLATLDHDSIDGGGLAIPHAAAALLKAPFGAPRKQPGHGGATEVRWRRQGASVGGAAVLFRQLGAAPGDRVRVVIRNDIEVSAVPRTTATGPWATVFSAMGLGEPPDGGAAALPVVAEAIGLAADAPHCAVVARLRLRGERFLADVVGDAAAHAYTVEP